MTTNEAKQHGVKAFNEGMHPAPAMNQAFIKDACGSDTDTCTLLDGYNHGFTIAMLADDAGLDHGIEPMPSVVELGRAKSQ